MNDSNAAVRALCRAGCFSGGCGDCWTFGCDHHGTILATPTTPAPVAGSFRTAPMKDGIRYDSRGEPTAGPPSDFVVDSGYLRPRQPWDTPAPVAGEGLRCDFDCDACRAEATE